jgi:hypothetical protein
LTRSWTRSSQDEWTCQHDGRTEILRYVPGKRHGVEYLVAGRRRTEHCSMWDTERGARLALERTVAVLTVPPNSIKARMPTRDAEATGTKGERTAQASWSRASPYRPGSFGRRLVNQSDPPGPASRTLEALRQHGERHRGATGADEGLEIELAPVVASADPLHAVARPPRAAHAHAPAERVGLSDRLHSHANEKRTSGPRVKFDSDVISGIDGGLRGCPDPGLLGRRPLLGDVHRLRQGQDLPRAADAEVVRQHMEQVRPMLVGQVGPHGLDRVLPDAAPTDEIDHGSRLVGDPDVEAIDAHPLDADLEVPRLARAARADDEARRAGLDPPARRDEHVDGPRDVLGQAVDRARRESPEHAAADLAGDRASQLAEGFVPATHVEDSCELHDLPARDQGGDVMGADPGREYLIMGQEGIPGELLGQGGRQHSTFLVRGHQP